MKYLFILLIAVLSSCKDPEPQVQVSPETKMLKEATLDDFVGEWEYVLDGKPYKKITIEKSGVIYSFKHYVMLAGEYAIDKDVYYSQNLDATKFVPYDKSSMFFPYINVNSSYTSGTAILTYKITSGKKLLELGITKYSRVGQ